MLPKAAFFNNCIGIRFVLLLLGISRVSRCTYTILRGHVAHTIPNIPNQIVTETETKGDILTHILTYVSREPSRTVTHHVSSFLVYTRPSIQTHLTGAAVDRLRVVLPAIIPCAVRRARAGIPPGGIYTGTPVEADNQGGILAFVNVISTVPPTPPWLADTRKSF